MPNFPKFKTNRYNTKQIVRGFKANLYATFKIVSISKDKGRKSGIYKVRSQPLVVAVDEQIPLNNAMRRAFAQHIAKHKILLKTGNIISLKIDLITYYFSYVYPKSDGYTIKKMSRQGKNYAVVRRNGRFFSMQKYKDEAVYNENNVLASSMKIELKEPTDYTRNF